MRSKSLSFSFKEPPPVEPLIDRPIYLKTELPLVKLMRRGAPRLHLMPCDKRQGELILLSFPTAVIPFPLPSGSLCFQCYRLPL